jgi:long-chain acyl-CoA synthetase
MNVAGLLARAAARSPDCAAVYEHEAVHSTYGQLRETAARIATSLRAYHGLEPGDRVALVGRNRPAYIEAMLGAWHAGMVVVPINYRLHALEVEHILIDSGAALCICDGGLRDPLESLAVARPEAERTHIVDWNELAADARARVPSRLHESHLDDLAWLFYTSGTTGRPKGVMLSHGNLRQMVLNFRSDVLAPAADHRFAHVAPLSHGSGMYLLASIAAGAGNVVPSAQSPHLGGLELLESHRGVIAFMAPTMVRRLVEHCRRSAFDTGRIELIVYGGGPMLLAAIEEAVAQLGPRLAQIYGQGESPMTITRLRREDIERSACGRDPGALASVGQPFTGVEVRVVDAQGRTLPSAEIGEVAVCGPVVMRGYWRNQVATAAQIRDGWLLTGDTGELDARGFLTLRDRARDVIVSGGMNIYPREIEEVLALHPRVAEVAVVGTADVEWGERVVAFIVTRDGVPVGTEQLESLCRSRIAGFKRPREYRFAAELPRNEYGKVLKRELRERLAIESTRERSGGSGTPEPVRHWQ